LVCRDIDILKDCKNCSVEISITTIDENVRKIFEPNADTIENRLACIKRLNEAGVETNVFFGPVLPYFSDNEASIYTLIDAFESVGVKRVLVDTLNYRNKKVPIIMERLKNSYPKAVSYYQNFIKDPNGYDVRLREIISSVVKNRNMNVEVVF
jgi:DNA repair photolyase